MINLMMPGEAARLHAVDAIARAMAAQDQVARVPA